MRGYPEAFYNDLVVVPDARDGIFWLRLYVINPVPLAVITEVPGNPGQSVTHAIERIAAHVATTFHLDLRTLVIFEIWPRGAKVPARVSRVSLTRDGRDRAPQVRGHRRKRTLVGTEFTGRPEWSDSTRRHIERLIGGKLPELPHHERLYERVLTLGGGCYEEEWQRRFEPVPVESLPPPHNPSSCAHIARFEEFYALLERSPGDSPADADMAVGLRFLDSLTPEDRDACPRHSANWKAIADESVRILNALGDRVSGGYMKEVKRSSLSEGDRQWLGSLFWDPIDIGAGGYTNGQHRGCALRFSGAERAVVVIGHESLGTVCVDWKYQGRG